MSKKNETKKTSVNPIILKYEDGIEFTLEFNRESVEYAEKHGFMRTELFDKMMVRVPELFYYAFRMHHPTVTKERTDEILFEDLGGIGDELTSRLSDLFNAPYETLLNDTGKVKNSKLTVVL